MDRAYGQRLKRYGSRSARSLAHLILPDTTYARLQEGKYWYLSLVPFARSRRERLTLLLFVARLYIAYLIPSIKVKRVVTIRLQGTAYVVGLKSAEIAALVELYAERIYERLPDFVPASHWTVCDVGANVGIFSIHQALHGVRVYAFEPNPACYQRFMQAVGENGLTPRVVAMRCAVGAAPSTGLMRVDNDWTPAGAVVPLTSGDNQPEEVVRITSLDHMLPCLGVDHLDLLKVDVEGAEVDVLRGAVQTLEATDRLIVEYHGPELLAAVRAFLNQHRFDTVLHVDVDAPSGVGLLYARRNSNASSLPTADAT